MNQRQFKIELLRKVDKEFKVIKESIVYEFDDECTSYNLWIDSLTEFEKELQDGDYIRTCFETIRYNADGTGTII